jgi:hypothetical protein
MRDAEILLCDINIALEKHPPWYVDRSPRGKDHRLLYASADIIKRLLAEIDELEKEKASLLEDINSMGDELYRLEG